MTPKTLLLPSGILQRGASALSARPSLPPLRPPPKRAQRARATKHATRPDARDARDDLEEDPEEDKTTPFFEALAAALDPTVPPFRAGEVIANKYRVEEVLGCGGMAWVLRATHLQLRQTVALKFLRFAATREAVARFFQEGRAAARVSSEAVTRILDVDTLPDGSPFLVMEFLDGRDLEKVVGDPGWIPVTTAVDLAIQACEGLAEVHAAGIVHRDLKPANLFLTRKRNGSIRMKLLDFGISKFAAGGPFAGHEAMHTSTQALMGSPIYMAPEQMTSTKHVDARADIWSLGVILYELLSGGCSPFRGETLPEVCMRVMRETPSPLTSFRGRREPLPREEPHAAIHERGEPRDRARALRVAGRSAARGSSAAAPVDAAAVEQKGASIDGLASLAAGRGACVSVDPASADAAAPGLRSHFAEAGARKAAVVASPARARVPVRVGERGSRRPRRRRLGGLVRSGCARVSGNAPGREPGGEQPGGEPGWPGGVRPLDGRDEPDAAGRTVDDADRGPRARTARDLGARHSSRRPPGGSRPVEGGFSRRDTAPASASESPLNRGARSCR
jgi:serine/threonine-protein kinase